ncbi:DNA processing protein [Evansella vedderi]|uniref:DNA processing protein n=1 Tax=Evansella vedderi TaxID=38282 RepID=A0ABT9ZR70_9BACI|nr:DNA-processing protein DprA [Evansella vedderi]MDQ0253725.1 DNA processing protein [Evansella vedderi]
MKNRIDNLLKLHYCCRGDYQLVKKLSTLDPQFSSIDIFTKDLLTNQLHIPPKQSSQIIHSFQSVKIEKLKAYYEEKRIQYFTVFDKEYPSLLKSIYDPPWVLYYQGDKSLLKASNRFLSVVGTRHPSDYVYNELKDILSPVIESGLVIVSGLALGIDRMAHELAIEKMGKTIAVLGYGHDFVYPKSNETLFHYLKENQLVISEYPPFVRPQKWFFPQRNRIISGLSEATFVVEAKEKSGSLITSDLAIQQGRDVFALPGRISNVESKGTNQLIQEGAKMVLSPNDILEEYLSLIR